MMVFPSLLFLLLVVLPNHSTNSFLPLTSINHDAVIGRRRRRRRSASSSSSPSSYDSSSSSRTPPVPPSRIDRRRPPSAQLGTSGGGSPTTTTTTTTSSPLPRHRHLAASYALHWTSLLQREYREMSSELQLRRGSYTRAQLESSGLAIFDASAYPESELHGEKIVRVSVSTSAKTNAKSPRRGGSPTTQSSFSGPRDARGLRDKFKRGDVLLLTPRSSFRGKDVPPREGLVMDVGGDYLTLGIGPSWPLGLLEMRKHTDGYRVRLDKISSTVPLRAQRMALDRLRKDEGGSAARLMMNLYYDDGSSSSSSYLSAATETPSHFARRRRSRREDEGDGLEGEIARAMTNAASGTSFEPNPSQREAVIWALQRNLALIRGPPGTGKTRCAALLIATAIRMELDEEADTEGNNIEGEEGDGVIAKTRASPRILAVTHSNGAADVLLQALLEINVPAVRAGRPASVSPSVQHRTIAALAERMPHVVRSRQQAGNVTLDEQTRQSAVYDAKRYMNDAKNMIVESASVVVTSCIGAQQLLSSIKDDAKEDDVATLKSSIFPIVVLDEAAQTTEPALISALVAARARQVIMVGDTRQLPPTVTSQDAELRKTLGVSPMERLLNNGIDEFVLTVQYRMPRALLYHPNKYFYDSVVKCATKNNLPSPKGFPWPSPNKEPLAFLEVGNGCDEVAHNFGSGRSNPTEVKVIIDIIGKVITAGEIHSKDIAIITPYSKQVQLFRTELSNAESSRSTRNGKCKISDVKVGTVDSFQGQETDLVIFSAVRSNLVKELGFLRDARRLNVAITRARRGLIVVGDPTVLVTCRHWAALLNSCTKRNCVLTLAEYNAHHTVDMITAVTEESPNENDMRSLLLELDTDDKLCDVIDC